MNNVSCRHRLVSCSRGNVIMLTNADTPPAEPPDLFRKPMLTRQEITDRYLLVNRPQCGSGFSSQSFKNLKRLVYVAESRDIKSSSLAGKAYQPQKGGTITAGTSRKLNFG
jgi:hypothetical protein